MMGLPPLARGVQSDDSDFARCIRITPAHAGSTLRRVLSGWLAWDRPRLRGEYPPSAYITFAILGSPPLARGVPKGKKYLTKAERITSACAGNTRPKRKSGRPSEDHPRLRGEYAEYKRLYRRH